MFVVGEGRALKKLKLANGTRYQAWWGLAKTTVIAYPDEVAYTLKERIFYIMLPEVQYVLSSLWLFICSALVMWMAAGFSMLEAGLVNARNNVAILTKNIVLYAVACVMYYAVGYAFMYSEAGGWFAGWGWGIQGVYDGTERGEMANFFFQVVFVATAASIVSGAVAGRMRFWPFMLFIVILTGVVYPIQGHWSWGGSALNGLLAGFSDYAGSTVVHSVGGWAALAGVIIVGPRLKKYGVDGQIHPLPGSNLTLAALGTFILWMGWLGFNGGSQLTLNGKADALAIGLVLVNTNMAAAGGVLSSLVLTQWIHKKIDLTMVLNGALSGLVAITAGPDYPPVWLAVGIGAVGGIITVFCVPLLDRLRLDDPVGAISVHLANGIWGTLAVGLFHPTTTLWTQAKGVLVVGAFTFGISLGLWWLIKRCIGLRVAPKAEIEGIDVNEFGMEAYPDFIHR